MDHFLSRQYTALDQPEVTRLLFHPRQDITPTPASCIDQPIPVADGVTLGARFHICEDANAVNILFFHGNGEVASDYDQVGVMYRDMGMNFLVIDYRGYGNSSGEPTVSTMIQDAHVVLDFVKEWLQAHRKTGKLAVMGRSLGSACAIELAAVRNTEIDGLIIESGFANTVPLMHCLGINAESLDITEENGFGNRRKIAGFTKPTFILHAMNDQLIAIGEANELQADCAARSKELQMVPGADHNTIMEVGGVVYFEVIKNFTGKLGQPERRKRAGVR